MQEQATSKGSSSRIEAKGATVHTFRSNDSPDAASSSREDQQKSALAFLQAKGLAELKFADETLRVLDAHYFIKLFNSVILLNQKRMEKKTKAQLARRRAAFQNQDWALYEEVVREMTEYEQAASAETCNLVSELLGISEEQFAEAIQMVCLEEESMELY